ncbi:hypothetical protein M9Y10_016953 [Tritrichomonas musculus]|uniref:Uncharacterized protein n=1 Tax=Tritrichomonas musculus TaxID=1915356 RepID=A0ABR2HXY6_9EUKA
MYNLAHIYLSEIPTEENINESIKLLLQSYDIGYTSTKILLIYALIKKFGFNIEKFRKELDKYSTEISLSICLIIRGLKINKNTNFDKIINNSFDLIYDTDNLYSQYRQDEIEDENEYEEEEEEYFTNVQSAFYEGLGSDILQQIRE